MIRFWGLAGLASIALWIFCVFDVIAAEDSLVRNLPRTLWLMIVIFVPTIGSVAWLALGRPQHVGWTPGSTDYRSPRRAVGPEDAADWPARADGSEDERRRRLREWEADLRRREDDLRHREPPSDPGPAD